jgi:hypothetical protein
LAALPGSAGFDPGALLASTAAGAGEAESPAGVVVDDDFRESLMYHPVPLKTTPTG